MVKKSVQNTMNRYEKESGKTALKKDGSDSVDFGKWKGVPDNCKPIVQSVYKVWEEKYLPDVEAGTIKPKESVISARAEVRGQGICYTKGNGERGARLKKALEDRKAFEKKYNIKFSKD